MTSIAGLVGRIVVWASGHLFSGLRDVELEASEFGPADVCSQDSGMLSSKPRETYVGTPQVLDGMTVSWMTGARCSVYHTPHHLYPSLSKSVLHHLLLSPMKNFTLERVQFPVI